MKLSNLIFGVALLLVAATLALTITFRKSPDEGDNVALPGGKAEYSKRETGSLPSRTSASPAAMRSNPTRGSQPRLPKVEELEVTIDDGPATQGMTPAQRQDVAKRLPWVRKNALKAQFPSTRSKQPPTRNFNSGRSFCTAPFSSFRVSTFA